MVRVLPSRLTYSQVTTLSHGSLFHPVWSGVPAVSPCSFLVWRLTFLVAEQLQVFTFFSPVSMRAPPFCFFLEGLYNFLFPEHLDHHIPSVIVLFLPQSASSYSAISSENLEFLAFLCRFLTFIRAEEPLKHRVVTRKTAQTVDFFPVGLRDPLPRFKARPPTSHDTIFNFPRPFNISQ